MFQIAVPCWQHSFWAGTFLVTLWLNSLYMSHVEHSMLIITSTLEYSQPNCLHDSLFNTTIQHNRCHGWTSHCGHRAPVAETFRTCCCNVLASRNEHVCRQITTHSFCSVVFSFVCYFVSLLDGPRYHSSLILAGRMAYPVVPAYRAASRMRVNARHLGQSNGHVIGNSQTLWSDNSLVILWDNKTGLKQYIGVLVRQFIFLTCLPCPLR